jgi:tetratricopeptide (TPR) repeat protein
MGLLNLFSGKNNKQQKSADLAQPTQQTKKPNLEIPPVTNVVANFPSPDNQTIPWRTFPIFISSTFADMQAERDHLKHVVFPKVEEELQKRRIKLEIVDLRWGVDTTTMTQEEDREANVLKVCLDEIRRCRPFFIGLLGDRYGWVPPLERMKTALAAEEHIVPKEGKSVTDLEIEFGVLASQEQLVRSVFYFREPLPYNKFSKKKAAMFSDEYNNELTDIEKTERKTALENLKTNIRAHFEEKGLKGKVKTYSAEWNETTEKLSGLEPWGDQVYIDILAECESHAKDTWDKVPKNWQEQEMALLDTFIENNTSTFCGRKPLLETLKKHLLSGDSANWGLVLTGESGSGKSAVFSMLTKIMQQENCFVLAHSAGLSPRAKNVADLLQIWNKQLADHLGIKEEFKDLVNYADDLTSRLTGEQDKASHTPIEKLQEKFVELLQMVSASKRVVMLIDALDRFEPTARAQHLSWLPSLLPQNVRLLCTAITGNELKAVKYHNGLAAKSIDIFSTAEAKEMLDALCLRQHKSLPAKIEKIILDKKRADGQPATSSPLWLSLAVNMLMAIDHDDFEKMSQLEGRGDQQIESYLAAMVIGFDPLPGPLFLSLKIKAGMLFGETFTTCIFNYITLSRNGLREKDLEHLLQTENITWDPLLFAGLRRWFKAHLVLQSEELQWNLAHSILRITLAEKLPEAAWKILHKNIGQYLMNLPGNDTLQITETMYHLMHCGNKVLAANWYGSFLLDDPRTDGSSKAMAEAVIIDETLGRNEWMDWLVSLLGFGDNEKLSPRSISYNFIFSLFDNHFQNDITIQTRIRLVQAAEARMEELHRRFPNSTLYARDLSISYDRLGNMNLKLGDPLKALDKYQASLNIREKLQLLDSKSTDYSIDLCISNNKLGDVYLKLGDHPKALEKYQTSLNISKKFLLHALDSDDYAHALSGTYFKIGDMYLLLGQTKKALENFQASLNITEKLRLRAPDVAEYAISQSLLYLKSGDLYISLGDPPKALEKYQVSLNIVEELRRLAPDSADYIRFLSVVQSKFADVYIKLGDIPKALEKYNASLRIAEDLRLLAPDSADYTRDLSISYSKLGDLYFSLDNLPKALEKYQASLNIAEELRIRAPDSAIYKRDLMICYEKIGEFSNKIGNIVNAKEKFERAFDLSIELHQKAPDSAQYSQDLSRYYSKLGDLYLSLGDPPKALDKYLASLNIAKELRERDPVSADYAHYLTISYYKILCFHQEILNEKELKKYAIFCKDALLYMKNRRMYLDDNLIKLLNQLEGYLK